MARSDTILRALARILPSEFRERVFEPALADLQLDERPSATRWRRWLARVFLVGECLRLGVPLLVWRRGRLTRFGTALLVAIVVLAVLIQRSTYTHAELPKPGGNGQIRGHLSALRATK